MHDFEKAFSDFIDRREYDGAQSALFSIIRIAFTAGWLAAGGNPPKSQNVVEIFRQKRITTPEDHSGVIETDIKEL